MLALGIPTGPVTAVLMAALLIHGVPPGPTLVNDHPNVFWGFVASMYVGNLMLLALNLPLVGVFVNLLRIPYAYLYPLIIMFCIIGVYEVNHSIVDVWIMLIMGVVGYGLKKFGFDPAPLVLGLVIAPIFEMSLRQSLIMSNGNWMIFLQRPIALALLAVSAVLLALAALSLIRRRKDWRAKLAEAEAGENLTGPSRQFPLPFEMVRDLQPLRFHRMHCTSSQTPALWRRRFLFRALVPELPCAQPAERSLPAPAVLSALLVAGGLIILGWQFFGSEETQPATPRAKASGSDASSDYGWIVKAMAECDEETKHRLDSLHFLIVAAIATGLPRRVGRPAPSADRRCRRIAALDHGIASSAAMPRHRRYCRWCRASNPAGAVRSRSPGRSGNAGCPACAWLPHRIRPWPSRSSHSRTRHRSRTPRPR